LPLGHISNTGFPYGRATKATSGDGGLVGTRPQPRQDGGAECRHGSSGAMACGSTMGLSVRVGP